MEQEQFIEADRATNIVGMKGPKTREKILAAYRIICEHPNGISKWDLIKKLDIRNSHIDGILASLEGTDMLISEDAGWYYRYKHEEYENIPSKSLG